MLRIISLRCIALLHVSSSYLTLPFIRVGLHYFVTCFLTLHYLTLITLRYLALPFLALPYISLTYLTNSYLTLPYLSLPYLALPYLTLPQLTLPYGPCLTYLPTLACQVFLRYMECTNGMQFVSSVTAKLATRLSLAFQWSTERNVECAKSLLRNKVFPYRFRSQTEVHNRLSLGPTTDTRGRR